jgi:hypothetical protein
MYKSKKQQHLTEDTMYQRAITHCSNGQMTHYYYPIAVVVVQ